MAGYVKENSVTVGMGAGVEGCPARPGLRQGAVDRGWPWLLASVTVSFCLGSRGRGPWGRYAFPRPELTEMRPRRDLRWTRTFFSLEVGVSCPGRGHWTRSFILRECDPAFAHPAALAHGEGAVFAEETDGVLAGPCSPGSRPSQRPCCVSDLSNVV